MFSELRKLQVLQSIGGFVIFIMIYLLALYGILIYGAAMILYASLDFCCIDRFTPTIASLF